jgi:hypothetical protein
MRDQIPNSPLIGEGNLIVSLGKQYNLNPMLYPVVAYIESSLGTNCCHSDNSNHNTWGDLIGGTGGGCVRFDSFEAAVRAYFQNLATNSAYKNDITVCDIINTASPPSDNPDYMSKFLTDFGGILQYAGKSITCKSSNPNPNPNPKPGEYVAPLSCSNIHFAGYDDGVDYCGNSPVYAIGDGVVLVAVQGNPSVLHWACDGSAGSFLSYKLTNGPNQGDVIYVAEGINIAPGIHAGYPIKAGQQIATMVNCIEIGFGQDTASCVACGGAHGGGGQSGGNYDNSGHNFGRFVRSLGMTACTPDPGAGSTKSPCNGG